MSTDHYQQLHADALVVDGTCPLLFDHHYLDWYREGGVDIVTPTVGTAGAYGTAAHALKPRGDLHRLPLIPDHNFAVIVFTNSDRGVEAYKAVADATVSAFTNLERQTAVAIGVDPLVLDPFVGVFTGTFHDFEITTDSGRYQLAQTSTLRSAGAKPPADPGPAGVANTSEGWLIVTEGPNKGALAELLEDPSGKRNYLRINNRIFKRSAE